MPFIKFKDVTFHYHLTGGGSVPIVFLNSLGTDFRIWDNVIARLDVNPAILTIDKRGHGLSDDGTITMDLLVSDVADLMDHLGLSGALVCGVSVGGMIAQGLASQRPDLVSGLMLCNTGAKIGDEEGWNARIDAVNKGGISSIADTILERWFSTRFRMSQADEFAGYRNMLTRTPASGYAGVSAAIRDANLTDGTAKLRLPTICIAGSEDMATPPDLVHSLSNLISGSTYELIDGVGHLPCIEVPQTVAEHIKNLHARLT